MKKEEELHIMNSAIAVFGFDKQIDMLIEECSELIIECCKLKRGRDHSIHEEMADALIMIEQIMTVLDRDLVMKIKEDKLIRLRERVKDKVRKLSNN